MYDTQFRVATFSINLSQIEIKVSDYRLIWSSSLIYISAYIYANSIVVGSTPSRVEVYSICDKVCQFYLRQVVGCLGILRDTPGYFGFLEKKAYDITEILLKVGLFYIHNHNLMFFL